MEKQIALVDKEKINNIVIKKLGFVPFDIIEDGIQHGYLKSLNKDVTNLESFIIKVCIRYILTWLKRENKVIYNKDLGFAANISSYYTNKVDCDDLFDWVSSKIKRNDLEFMLYWLSLKYGERKKLGAAMQVKFSRLKKHYASKISKIY